jgi:hypothetical protein
VVGPTTMKLATFRYLNGAWSRPFPDLDSERTMVLVFAAATFVTQPARMIELAAAYPRSAMIGCSTAGEIDQTEVRDGSITVAVVQFERTRVRQAEARIETPADAYAAGARIAAELMSPELRAVLVLAPGTSVNGSALVSGLNVRLPAHLIVTGGLAGAGDRADPTWVVASGRIEPRHVVAVGLYGEHVRASHGSGGGWDPFGAERVVTRAKGTVLLELDNRPALALYKELLGDRAVELPASARRFPLLLRAAKDEEHGVARAVIGVDEAAQSLTLAAEVPVGWHARVMHVEPERLIQGAQAAGGAASARFEGPVLCIAISCVGRRLVLGDASAREAEAALDALPVGTAQVGFYAHGEIAPYASARCSLHNELITLIVVGEIG